MTLPTATLAHRASGNSQEQAPSKPTLSFHQRLSSLLTNRQQRSSAEIVNLVSSMAADAERGPPKKHSRAKSVEPLRIKLASKRPKMLKPWAFTRSSPVQVHSQVMTTNRRPQTGTPLNIQPTRTTCPTFLRASSAAHITTRRSLTRLVAASRPSHYTQDTSPQGDRSKCLCK